MADTANLALPLVAAAQTQKHITVNETLCVVDALIPGLAEALDLADPPSSPELGSVFGVASAPTGDWINNAGDLAIWMAGGWRFLRPRQGWRLFEAARSGMFVYDQGGWRTLSSDAVEQGAFTGLRVATVDHVLDAAPSSTTANVIPSHAHVIGVTARVLSEFTSDSGTSWRIGVSGSEDRYGTGYGFAPGATAKGLTGSGVTYYSDTPLVLTCEGGSFTGGSVRMAVHYFEISEPT